MPTCSTCGKEKNQEDFARRGEGYRGYCRDCGNIKRADWEKRNPEKRRATLIRYSLKKYGRAPVPAAERKLTDEMRAARKKEKAKIDYQKNRARYLRAAKERAARERGKISAYHAEWRKNNAEKKRASDKVWRENNAAKLNSYYSARRDRRRKSEPSWLSAIERAQIQEMYDVAMALTTQTGVKHHVDHIHPLGGLGFSGLHVPWNMRVITAQENLSKGNRLPIEEQHLAWGE